MTAAPAATQAPTVNGRPLRVLHIGNIANNAYNNAKLQRQAGIEADVLCNDYYHIMGSPEWEDADIEGTVANQYYPQWHKVNLKGFRRPEWFIQGNLSACVKYLVARNEGHKFRAWYYSCKMAFVRRFSFPLGAPQLFLGQVLGNWLRLPSRMTESVREFLGQRCHPAFKRSVLFHFFLLSTASAIHGLVSTAIFSLCLLALLPAMLGWFTIRLLPTAPRGAEQGVRFWEFWARFPGRLADSLGQRLGNWLNLAWLQRSRGQALLLLVILPLYFLISAVVGVGVLLIALLLSPLVLLVLLYRGLRKCLGVQPLDWNTRYAKRCAEIQAVCQATFPDRPPVQLLDLQHYAEQYQLFAQLLQQYDIVQAYSIDAMWPFLCDFKPYIAYEHGTLRDLPWTNDLQGLLTSLAYHFSAHTFVTNGDCRAPAEKLRIPHFSPMLHGIDDSKFGPNDVFRSELLRTHQVGRLYLCSIRHDWAVKGTDKYIRALPELIRQTGPDFRLFMMKWGAQVEDSQRLASELGVADHIVWLDPLPKTALIKWMGAMDCILDQIAYPCFGATAPEAMGCGTPVIMSFDPNCTRWIIDEPAPILSAWTPTDIVAHLVALLDSNHRAAVSARGLHWFRTQHSCSRILHDHLVVYTALLRDQGLFPRLWVSPAGQPDAPTVPVNHPSSDEKATVA